MEKQLFVTILFTLLMSMFAQNAYAHDIEVKNADGITIYYVWTNNKTELSVSFYGGDEDEPNYYSGNVVIPESVVYEEKTYRVTSIGYRALHRSNVTSVTIPNSVKYIGSEAFERCSSLTSVTIPNSVDSIGSDAFRNTAWYDNQPDGLVYAGKVAYKYKGDMPVNTRIIIKDGSLGIAGSAFYNCSGLTSVTIPNSVTSIGSLAFYNCTSLTSVSVPNSVTAIGEGAFGGCNGLFSVSIPNSVTSIDDYAFKDCI